MKRLLALWHRLQENGRIAQPEVGATSDNEKREAERRRWELVRRLGVLEKERDLYQRRTG